MKIDFAADKFSSTITSERLILRAVTPASSARIFDGIISSLSSLREFPATLPWAVGEQTLEMTQQFCIDATEKFVHRREAIYEITPAYDLNAFCGLVGMHGIRWDEPKCEIGFWGASSMGLHGYMTEAVAACVKSLRESRFRRITAVCDSENLRAINVCRRAGFEQEGFQRNERRNRFDGTLRHMVLFSIVV